MLFMFLYFILYFKIDSAIVHYLGHIWGGKSCGINATWALHQELLGSGLLDTPRMGEVQSLFVPRQILRRGKSFNCIGDFDAAVERCSCSKCNIQSA